MCRRRRCQRSYPRLSYLWVRGQRNAGSDVAGDDIAGAGGSSADRVARGYAHHDDAETGIA